MYIVLYVPFSVFYEIILDFPLRNGVLRGICCPRFQRGQQNERLCG